MPSTLDAINFILAQKDFYFAPAKAANAGDVSTSGLEMMQNAGMTAWSFERVDHRLHGIINHIFELSYETSKEFWRREKPGTWLKYRGLSQGGRCDDRSGIRVNLP